MLIVFLVVFLPNIIPVYPNPLKIMPSTIQAKQVSFAPSNGWMSSLSWLKENTPDPFGNPDAYYGLHEPPPPGESYNYPESAYGVMAWWDYGYWITRIAHRIPNANPSQSRVAVPKVARFFSAQDENSANEIVKEIGSAYVIIDYQAATGKFYAIATWAGSSPEEFLDVYYVPQEGKLMPIQLYYPEYYRSLSTRLYNFDGKAVTPDSSTVISYEEKSDKKGTLYKIITSEKQFDSYEAAEAYLSSQESANYKIVSSNSFTSPVPLEALEHYKLVHSSSGSMPKPGGERIPAVKIFEYID